MKKPFLLLLLFISCYAMSIAQPDRWQQRVKYTMNINVDVPTNRFTGKERLEYSNNSPDELNKVFYHLYWNAFQPNSAMDVRSREAGKIMINNKHLDWDNRIRDRILNLKPDEIGYDSVISLKMNGVPQPIKYHETILEVDLTQPILPKTKVVFEMEFACQVPLQIRRSGRDNPTTGVRYSMSQWYPKLCEYDYEGWHPTPYVLREFYGVWGDYDVTINIDKTYKLGGTGVLANALEVGWGYDKPGSELKPTLKDKRTWHFIGNNIHDFVWAADPDYIHLVRKIPNGPIINVLYKYKQNDPSNDSSWKAVADAAPVVLPFIEKHFGKYPYPQYSFIQGGDGGMEYPMATLLLGPGLEGNAFHEWMHSWYQMMLGTNEGMYAWMDEGFTSYAENLVSAFFDHRTSLQGYREMLKQNPDNKELKDLVNTVPENHCDAYSAYYQLVKSGLEEPLTTHADHFNTNYAYTIASYCKGEIFLEQLGYIVGADVRDKILLEYYHLWRFKHPNPGDFFRVAENVSGLKLDWYREYWCNTTKTINYGIDSLWEEDGVSKIRLKKIGKMPMPIDLQLTFKDGSTEMYYIPLDLMFGEKPNENSTQTRIVEPEWKWTDPTYTVDVKYRLTNVVKVEIDPSRRMADIDRKNNIIELKW